MKSYLKPFLVSAAVVVVGVLIAVLWAGMTRPTPTDRAGGAPQTVREDSRILDVGGDGAVTVVEFLDFECEACGAAYPLVEDLREEYAGRITYVVRYFPLPGHSNSLNAAVAAEAAGRQARFEEMYHALFRSQAQWGEANDSRADLFRTYAAEIGLDLAVYDRDVADPATIARVRSDLADGRALGVSWTPTFFVDGRQIVEPTSWSDVTGAIDAALAR